MVSVESAWAEAALTNLKQPAWRRWWGMYERPKLVRYGSFRELTQAGWSGGNDHLLFKAIDGCNLFGCEPHVHTSNCEHAQTSGSR